MPMIGKVLCWDGKSSGGKTRICESVEFDYTYTCGRLLLVRVYIASLFLHCSINPTLPRLGSFRKLLTVIKEV